MIVRKATTGPKDIKATMAYVGEIQLNALAAKTVPASPSTLFPISWRAPLSEYMAISHGTPVPMEMHSAMVRLLKRRPRSPLPLSPVALSPVPKCPM